MKRILELEKQLDVNPDKRQQILLEFAKQAFNAGCKFQFNKELSLIDKMPVGKPNFDDWISKTKT